ncbi:N-acetylglucosamine-6-phosphate deacetylase [Dendrosporobacter sp. 1207_IL3150]|uniref:N-acetylglucosamine-6-phosphate deacetylase n=1 Tax=Dendrosporobacter sp. 1207_IL3150 TaxID=3084054 RepID=UPI002FD9B876
MKQLIHNGTIVFPDHVKANCDMKIVDGVIDALGSNLTADNNLKSCDFSGDIIIPGLIDTHVHGAGGCDIMDGTAESLVTLRQALLQEGTTAFLGTTLSSPVDQLLTVLDTIDAGRKDKIHFGQAELLGVHLEGPFLTAEYKGAHVGKYIPPSLPGGDIAILTRLVKSFPNLIKILTFAIDRLDAADLAAFCQSHGIIPSAGHTAADYMAMSRAAEAGIQRITHAFNTMPGIHHRKPGPMTEGLLNNDIELELIADGIHIHPAILEMAFRLKPQDKVTLVSDGTRSVGMPEGEYELGGLMTTVKNGIALLADGTIAGSAFPLLQGIRTMVQVLNRPLHEAVRFASLNPARSLGISHRMGSLEPGKEATFVRLSSELMVKQVWVKGELVVDRIG